MTRSEFIGLKIGDTIHWGNCTRATGPRGGVTTKTVAYRVTRVQTWKRDTNRRSVSVARGMYDHAKLTNDNPAHYDQFHVTSACALLDTGDHSASETHSARVQPVTAPILGAMTFYRVVCTCGLVTRESHSEARADRAISLHLAGESNARVMSYMLSYAL